MYNELLIYFHADFKRFWGKDAVHMQRAYELSLIGHF